MVAERFALLSRSSICSRRSSMAEVVAARRSGQLWESLRGGPETETVKAKRRFCVEGVWPADHRPLVHDGPLAG
jgi:hypothetical protein